MRDILAQTRFGIGRRGDEPLPPDPMKWLADQLKGRDPLLAQGGLSTAACLNVWRQDSIDPPSPRERSRVSLLLDAERMAFTNNVHATKVGFRERLVWFWFNHFTISLNRPECPSVLGAYVREAIRPHVNGKFIDMVMAVMRHPAMLMYLDNYTSVGPDSPIGKRLNLGLNENLARECMELHTLSPASGYSQHDVTEFAKVITGWTIDFNAKEPGFVFDPDRHQPGAKTVMGKVFPPGEQGGIAALKYYADHPSTHRFLATKLVRHFVADVPTPADVRAVEGVLRDTRGDLAATAVALTQLKSAWTPMTKFRSPLDYTAACTRAVELPPQTTPIAADVLAGLGMPLWTAPLPNGWPDEATGWSGPEALLRRAEWINRIATRFPDVDPEAIAVNSMGPLLNPETMAAIRFAGSRREALVLALASPEFHRR